MAAFWSVAGAGIYGSPLSGMQNLELTHALAFLVFGPFTAFFASIEALGKPRWGGVGLVAGAVFSGFLAIPYLTTDAFVIPIALVSAPMYFLGKWLLRATPRALDIEPDDRTPTSPKLERMQFNILIVFVVASVAWVVTFSIPPEISQLWQRAKLEAYQPKWEELGFLVNSDATCDEEVTELVHVEGNQPHLATARDRKTYEAERAVSHR